MDIHRPIFRQGALLVIIFITGIVGGLFLFSGKKVKTERFRLANRQFFKDGEHFFPLVLNYLVSTQSDGSQIWPAPASDYVNNIPLASNRADALRKLKADFTLIADLGFNTIRVVGIGEPSIDESGKSSPELFVLNAQGTGQAIVLDNEHQIDRYLDAVADLFNTARQAGLNVIYLVKVRSYSAESRHLLRRFCTRFKHHPALLAIDIYNEPLYFDTPEKLKSDIAPIVKSWRKIIRYHAPDKLVTIGLVGIREVFRWDPNILDVDFISYHPYEYEPEQVRNELYWYGQYTRKPWIIGETAIPADNDSVSYSDQVEFARKTLYQAIACGASGYSWWQYKDVNWQKYHASYMGILNRNGFTVNSDGDTVQGTVKPVGLFFKEPLPPRESLRCEQLPNYANYSEANAFRLTGKVTNEHGKGIEGAVVLAWNEYWTHSFHTVSDANGNFVLKGTYPFYHWIASAVDYTMVRGDVPLEKQFLSDSIPTVELQQLKIRKIR